MTSSFKHPWIIRTYAGFGSAADTNGRFLENLGNGQTGLSVAFDLPTQNGYDPDAPMARGEVGGCGVSIAHLGDIEELFRDIDLGTVNTSMTINATAPFLLAAYLVLSERRGIPREKLHGTVQNDLLKEFVARGTSIFSPATSLRLSTDVITFAAQHLPHWNPINVCGYHYMESGARPHEEIGYAFGNAMLVLDSIRPRLTRDLFERVVKRISFFIGSGIELIPEICKMRAYTRLWRDLCREEYQVHDVQFRAGCQVRSLSLTAQQPENNIVRIALEALPVLLSANARVNALQLPGFREALALPDRMEQTLSLRTQQILMHETKITEYPDIFDGNDVIAELTDSIVDNARLLAGSVRASGYKAAVDMISAKLTSAMYDRQQRIESCEDFLVGVNCFSEAVGLSEQLAPAPATAQDQRFEEERCKNVAAWRETRDAAAFGSAAEALAGAARAGTNILQASIDFVRMGGTVGEWTSIIADATDGRHGMKFDLHAAGTNGSGMKSPRPIRIVLGKAGLDGHTNAIKLIALACRNAGMEVIFAGTHLTPGALMKAAVEEDAELLGISCLSGAHLSIAKELIACRAESGAHHLKILLGGTIPSSDRKALEQMGVIVADASAGITEVVRKIIGVGST